MRNAHVFLKGVLYLLPVVLLLAGTAVPASAYNVSGTVNYSGSKSGRVYLSLHGSNGLGTSIPAKGAFTIRGAPNGDYTLYAYMDNNMDNIGNGFQHASNPVGSTNVTVSGGNATANVTLTDSSVNPVAPAWLNVSPASGGVFIQWDAPEDQNGVQIADSYSVYWSTSSTLSPLAGSKLDILADDQNFFVPSLTNGTNLYFRVTAKTGSSASAASAIVGPVLVGTPAGGYNVTGTVTFTPNFAATGPLYLAVTDNDGKMFFSRIASPTSGVSFTVPGVQNGNYMVYSFIDMNNDGVLNVGDIENGSSSAPSITVNNGPVTGVAITLKNADVKAKVRTDHYTGGSESYNLEFSVDMMTKRPVNVFLTGGPGGISYPTDIAFSSRNGGFSFWSPQSPTPVTGSIYTLSVTYSDGATDPNVQATITGVNNSFPAIVSPVGPISGPGSTTPTFSWTPPASLPAGANYYQLWLSPQYSGGIWSSDKIPIGNTSVLYNNDGSASQPALTPGMTYNWAVGVQDGNGNRAYAQSSFTIAAITFSGFVTNSAGAPISGVTVELVGNPSLFATTDGNGYYSLAGLPYGTDFVLKTSKSGYLPAYTANINSIFDITDPAPGILFTQSELNTNWGVTPGKGAITAIAVDIANWTSNLSGAVVTAASALHPGSPYPVTYFNGSSFGGIATFSNGLVFVFNVDDGDTVTLHATKSGLIFYDATLAVHGNSVSEGLLLGAPAQRTLAITVPGAGTGSGTVTGSGQNNGTPVDLSFGTNYSGAFDTGTQVNLHAASAQYSTFTGWSGACTGLDDCAITMDGDKNVTATFDYDIAHKTHIEGTSSYFSTLKDAYESPSSTGNTIQAWGVDFPEDLNANQNKSVSIKGGFNSGYIVNTGYYTTLNSVTIGTGTLTVENLVVK